MGLRKRDKKANNLPPMPGLPPMPAPPAPGMPMPPAPGLPLPPNPAAPMPPAPTQIPTPPAQQHRHQQHLLRTNASSSTACSDSSSA